MTDGPAASVDVLVGGVSELFQRDLDLGRLAVQRLRAEELGAGVAVEDLHYGAVAVAQRLEDLRPSTLVLISAVRRDRAPGTVERCYVTAARPPTADVQAAVADAVTGYVHPDLVVEVAAAFGALPPRTITVEVEPAATGSGEGLSEAAASGLEQALDVVRTEVRRAAALDLAANLRSRVLERHLDRSAALSALGELLAELERVDAEGRWGATFALRDRFKRAIAGGLVSAGASREDWALWWALIEELDRLEQTEAAAPT